MGSEQSKIQPGVEYRQGQVRSLAHLGRQAARRLAVSTGATRNTALEALSANLARSRQEILSANSEDTERARADGLSESLLARLLLTPAKLDRIARGVIEIAALPDPVGRIKTLSTRPNGLILQSLSVPLGLVGMVYEARPEVTVDASALCIKSGNAVLLRGGKEAFLTNHAFLKPVREALVTAGLPADAVSMIETTDREAVRELVRLDGLVDVAIPRGGEALIAFVRENATVPCIFHAKGVCHVFVDEGADLDMAVKIALNAKVSSPAVCNAMETLLVHRDVAGEFLPKVAAVFQEQGVQIHGDAAVRTAIPGARAVTDAQLSSEYLRKEVSIVVVDGLQAALDHIARFGSNNTEAIVTGDQAHAERFLREVDSSSVMWNASTRFADGGEYGLGAEIGISTQKLPPRGPVGVEGLTTWKFLVRGSGQVRE